MISTTKSLQNPGGYFSYKDFYFTSLNIFLTLKTAIQILVVFYKSRKNCKRH